MTTSQMQTEATFLEAGWDFVGETANGTEDIWKMNCEGRSYPKLAWQQPVSGDFGCPDGVDMIDLDVMVKHWLAGNCNQSNNYCNGTDLNADGGVNYVDLALLAENWRQGE